MAPEISPVQLLVQKQVGKQIYTVFYGIHVFEIKRIASSHDYVNGYWQVKGSDLRGEFHTVTDCEELNLALDFIEKQYKPGITGGTHGNRRVTDKR